MNRRDTLFALFALGAVPPVARAQRPALPAPCTLSIPVFDTVLNGTSVIGSIVGTRADLNEVFGLHAAGRTRVSYETRPLAEVNQAIAEVLHGKARARLVLEP